MKLILVDPNIKLCREWAREFQVPLFSGDDQLMNSGAQTDVEVRHGILQVVTDADALVTAGNAFGLKDGGVDRVVAEMLPGIEREVQTIIREQHFMHHRLQFVSEPTRDRNSKAHLLSLKNRLRNHRSEGISQE